MAIKIENFDSFEVNGKTYTGVFPLYSSDAVCANPNIVDYKNQTEDELLQTDEGEFVNLYTPTPTPTPTTTPTSTPTANFTDWTPAVSDVCDGVSFLQTKKDLNGNFADDTRTMVGTKQPTWTAYIPDASSIPAGQSFQQTRTNDCGDSMTITSIGTKISIFFEHSIIISSNVNNYDGVTSALYANGWNGTKKVDLNITVNSGVIVGSSTPAQPSLNIPLLPTGSIVRLINRGKILGAGGTFGLGGIGASGQDGEVGGTALAIRTTTIISNYGQMKAGGGGGGGGAGYLQTNICDMVEVCRCCDRHGNDDCPSSNRGDPCNTPDVCWWVIGRCNRGTLYAHGKKINASYSGGNGGFGEGSYGTAVTGLVGTGGKPGGSGGSYGKDGSAGSSYNKTSVGGKGGLAGYYIKIEYTPNNDVSYSYVKGLGGFVDGRIG